MLSSSLIGPMRVVHVVVSLAALVLGIVFVFRVASGRYARATSAWFVASTLLTSITALVIHPLATGPAHTAGFISIAILIPSAIPLGIRRPTAVWRYIHALAGLAAFYINALAAVVTAFQFEPHLRQLAPVLAHPPLATSQFVAAMAIPSFTLSLAAITAPFLAAIWPICRSASSPVNPAWAASR